MPIPFRCSGCGKEYRVDETMAGKQATCRCGATTRVPSQGPEEGDVLPEDWVADAFRRPASAPPPPAPEPAMARPEPRVPPAPTAVEAPRSKGPRRFKPLRGHKLVAFACIAYGTIAAVLVVVLEIPRFPSRIIGSTTDVGLAATIAAAGVLILKRHRHGPTLAALASLFLCSLSGWGTLLSMLKALSANEFVAFLGNLAFFALAYGIPLCVIVWSVRAETAIQEDEAADD